MRLRAIINEIGKLLLYIEGKVEINTEDVLEKTGSYRNEEIK